MDQANLKTKICKNNSTESYYTNDVWYAQPLGKNNKKSLK